MGKLVFQVIGAFAEFERKLDPATDSYRPETGRRTH